MLQTICADSSCFETEDYNYIIKKTSTINKMFSKLIDEVSLLNCLSWRLKELNLKYMEQKSLPKIEYIIVDVGAEEV